MKIAFVLPHSPQYAKISEGDYLKHPKYEHQYCKALRDLGHEAELFVLSYKKKPYRKRHIFGHFVNFIPVDFKLGNSEFSFKLLEVLWKSNFDIYHLHAYYFPMFDPLSVMCKIKNFSFVCQFHGKGPGQPRFFDRLIKFFTLRLPAKILCVTREEVDNVKKVFGLPSGNVTFFPNGLDLDYFKPRIISKEQMKLSGSIFYLLFVGRLSFHNKGVDTLINAVSKLPDDVKLLVIGDGPDFNNMLELIKKLDLEDRVIPLGGQPGSVVVKYYNVVDCIVAPSNFDFWPGVVLEGMYSKKPVIASKVGGIPDMIDNWKTGILVEPGNVNQIVNTVLKLKKDKKLSSFIGNNAHKKVKTQFNWDIIGKRAEKIYEEVLR